MVTRRNFMLAGAAAGAALPAARAGAATESGYEQAVRETWRAHDAGPP